MARFFIHHPIFAWVLAIVTITYKLVLVFILTGNPAIGILGVPIGTALCNLAIAPLNILSIGRCVEEKPRLVRNLLRPLFPAAIMAAAVIGVKKGLTLLLGAAVSPVIVCGGSIAVGAIVYLGFVVVCKEITYEDCLLLPKGEKIAKLLRL